MDLKDFNALASGTRLSKDSRDAARLVFVEGMSQTEAGLQMQISPQRMNQICQTIRREQEKKQTEVAQSINALTASHAIAVKSARDQFGDEVRINTPVDSKRTVGEVVARTDFHLVQHVGKDGVVIHDLAKLDRAPTVGRNVAIEYTQGRGSVVDRSQEKERGGLSR